MPVARNSLVETGIDLAERNELVRLAEMYAGYETYTWNANINGTIVQLRTNDPHLDDFWRENWFPAAGLEHDHTTRPHGVIYSVTNVPDTEPRAVYHSDTKTSVVINMGQYETVRSIALGIAMDVSEEQKDIHFLRGALVDVNGEGVVITGERNAGRTTQTFLLLELNEARIHSNDWIYVEKLGGERGRISTLVSERKFHVKDEVARINSRVKELIGKCRRQDDYLILDPWWLGGQEKFLDTTRIKLIFILQRRPNEGWVSARIPQKEAITLLRNAPDPFYNPHWLVRTEDRMALQTAFWGDILQFAACYRINTTHPTLEVQERIREIIRSREYLVQVHEGEDAAGLQEVIRPDALQSVTKAISTLFESKNVFKPSQDELKAMAFEHGTGTKFGNYAFGSTVKNRSAPLTVALGSSRVMSAKLNPRQKQIVQNLPATLQDVHEYIKKAPFVCVQRTMGDNDSFNPTCRLFVSTQRREMVRLAYMVGKTLPDHRENPDEPLLQILHIPEWQEKDRQVLVFPEIRTTYVLGTDYYGEDKKGFLRMAMYEAKQRGMLGLHAGAKVLRASDRKSGKIKRYSMVIFGLTATGKTTHTCHDHGLTEEGEGIEIVQDDVIFLRDDGSAYGPEIGFYLKTEGVDPRILPLIYHAVAQPGAIFENVLVDYQGNVAFGDRTLTGNGRGIMQRDDFGKDRSESLNIPPLTQLDGMIILFVTRRNTVVPPVSRLNAEQAAAAFMLGESIESSGSDPARAGESVRVVGMNPFIVGDLAQEGNMMYKFAKDHQDKLQFYLFNTGGVGEIAEAKDGKRVVLQHPEDIGIPESAAIIRAIARGEIEWKSWDYFNVSVPESVPGIDIKRYDLSRFYSKELADAYVRDLNEERTQWLSQFKGLNPAVLQAFSARG